MVDQNTKQKLKRIWRQREIISLFVTTTFDFIAVQVSKIYSHAWEAQTRKAQAQAQETDSKYIVSASTDSTLKVWNLSCQPITDGEYIVIDSSGTTLRMWGLSGQPIIEPKGHTSRTSNASLLLKQRNRVSLNLIGQLITFIPEECVAELGALYQQKKSEQHSIWFIRTIMLWSFLELLWAFYIQINVENLWLPNSKERKKIDE